jgi:hypothetical protein
VFYSERFLSLALVSLLLLAVAPLPRSAHAQQNGPSACLNKGPNYNQPSIDTRVQALKDSAAQEGNGYGYADLLAQNQTLFDIGRGLSNGQYWYDLSSSDGRVWCYGVGQRLSESLKLRFSSFELAAGTELHIYPKDAQSEDDTLRSYAPSQSTSGGFETDRLNGEDLLVAFYEPSDAEGQSDVKLSKIVWAFSNNTRAAFGGSASCHINADPTSDCQTSRPWASQIYATAQYVRIGQFGQRANYSTTILNNVSEDLTPYVHLAAHTVPQKCPDNMKECRPYQVGETLVGYNGGSSPSFWDHYLRIDYQSDFCGTGTPPSRPSFYAVPMNGAEVKATNTNGGDFALVELPERIPPAYRVQYAGWSAREKALQEGTVVGHPQGDAKKIGFASSISNSFSDTYTLGFAGTNDGAIQGGNSGSPLVDKNRRFVGHVSRGDSLGCEAAEVIHPRLSSNSNWTYGPSGERLKDALANGTDQKMLLPVAGYDLDVANETFTDSTADYSSGFFRTAGRIDVKGDVTVESGGGRLVLRAREGIRIEGPFLAEAGSEFEARIDDGPHLSDINFPSASSPAAVASTSGVSGSSSTSSKQVKQDEKQKATAAAQAEAAGRPEEFALHAPYPNPSDGQVTVRYAIPKATHVEMVLFDALGRQMQRLASENQSARLHRLTFDTEGLSSGMYFIHMRANNFTATQAVTIVK